ncbi:PAP2 family protein [Marinomonas sp. UCMA 3892]|uniref:phosphatase PAP2 family protein n=1 Tax=unclassified Marinomonas TaxID=196814 RepID=UPI00146D2603|nr:phosphatase PAP2 family protein [Marinomonas sp. UCMA 3892]NLU97834.1 PAP2 family protein [Marinomonas sp. UCMA 3892]
MFSLYNPAEASWGGFLRLKFNKNRKNIIFNGFKVISKIALLVFPVSYISVVHADDSIIRAGDNLQIGIPIVAGVISMMKGDFAGTGEWAEGALWTSVATHTLKLAVDEERPNRNDNNSFPSGHTSAAFQGAAFLQMRYGWEYGLPAYAAAGFVGYSRVHGDYHYWHDVAAGAALAVGIQYVITEMGLSARNLVIAPIVSGKQYGLYASMSY